MNAPDEAGRFGSGHTVRRVEDPALVLGRGVFTDDVSLPNQTWLAFVRSSHAHARIVSIDSAAAEAMPGVVAVLTGAQLAAAGVKPLPQPAGFKRPDGAPATSAPRWPLAHEMVRFVGEPVAAVIAESSAAAREAAEAVWVDYEERAAVVDPLKAMRPDAPQLSDAPNNIAAEMRHGDAQATARAFASAAHVVQLDLVNQRLAPVSMEPRSISATMDDAGRLQVRMSTQMPTGIRNSLAALIPGLTNEQVRVVVGDVGGGFGMKGGIYPEDVVVAYAAKTLNRPVKWQAERIEDFLSAAHGRDLLTRAELALDANGRVLGLRVRSIANVGGYAMSVGVAIPLMVGPWVMTSIYDIQVIDFHLTAVMTNTAPVGAYRGAGRPEAIYIIERLFDAAAREMKLDPSDLRRRNMIRPEQMPYTNPMRQVYDTGAFERILERALQLADWSGFDARRCDSRARGKLRGRGIATFLEWTGGNVLAEKVGINVLADGVVEVISATQGMGQGIATSLAQLAVDAFGLPIDKIRIVTGDTDRATGFGSAGSRSLFTGGSAVKVASEQAIEHAKTLAGDALEAATADIDYADGAFTVTGTDVTIGLFDLAGRQPERRIFFEATTSATGPSWPNGCHVSEVEIDPLTGAVEIVAYTSVSDIGRVISPQIVRGQIEGGAVQGIGQALCERIVYDPDSGQALTASFLDYAIPRADVFLGFRTEFDSSIPCKTNALGVKGVGELGTIGATPCTVNAVIDALDHAGLGREAERVQMPLTSQCIWRALTLRDVGEPVFDKAVW